MRRATCGSHELGRLWLEKHPHAAPTALPRFVGARKLAPTNPGTQLAATDADFSLGLALGKSFLNSHSDESLIGDTSSLSSRFRRFGLRFRKMHMDPSGIGGWEQTYCAPRS